MKIEDNVEHHGHAIGGIKTSLKQLFQMDRRFAFRVLLLEVVVYCFLATILAGTALK